MFLVTIKNRTYARQVDILAETDEDFLQVFDFVNKDCELNIENVSSCNVRIGLEGLKDEFGIK